MLELSRCEFDEEYEREREEREPPREVSEKLRGGETSNVETEEESLTKSTGNIRFGWSLTEKLPSECEERKRTEHRGENRQGGKEYPLTDRCQCRRVNSKNENAEDTEGRERDETEDNDRCGKTHQGKVQNQEPLALVYGFFSRLASHDVAWIKEK